MDAANTVAIIVAILSTLGGGWQYLEKRKVARDNAEQAQRLAALEKRRVEAEAYDKARAHYDAIIEDLTQHIAWLKQELATSHTENTKLRERIAALEKTIEALKSTNVIVVDSPGRVERKEG